MDGWTDRVWGVVKMWMEKERFETRKADGEDGVVRPYGLDRWLNVTWMQKTSC